MRALITGAAHGLGRALTEELLAQGHEVLALDRDTDPLDDLVVKSRGACTVRLVDFSNPDSVERVLIGLSDIKFDLVILNAGISATGKFEDIPSDAYSNLIAINVTAPIRLASALMRLNAMTAKSKIVFISSLSHAVGYPGASVYAATKDAVATYAKSVRKPFLKKGVRILTVYPGPIRTGHAEKHAPPGAKAERRMEPEKLAKLILKTARSRTSELYPGTMAYLAKIFGQIAPRLATKSMRKAIYDKLEYPEY